MNRGPLALSAGVGCLAAAGACALIGVTGALLVVVLVLAVLAAASGVAVFVVDRRA